MDQKFNKVEVANSFWNHIFKIRNELDYLTDIYKEII